MKVRAEKRWKGIERKEKREKKRVSIKECHLLLENYINVSVSIGIGTTVFY
jgi:hypothetical protein